MTTRDTLPPEFEAVLADFAAGIEGEDLRPSDAVLSAARELVVAAVRRGARPPEISFAEIDGELTFDLRLPDGRLVLAELGPDGTVHAGVFNGGENWPDATEYLSEHHTTDYDGLLALLGE